MSRTPIVRPISWLNAAINLTILGCWVFTGWLLNRQSGVLFGAAGYLLLSTGLRSILARHHRRAISLCKRQQFELAIPQFEQSLNFFRNNTWVDDWRAFTMLSAAGMCYREMALVSLGFCYGQIGDGVRARYYYEQALQEFPANKNGMAEAALRLMDAARDAERGT